MRSRSWLACSGVCALLSLCSKEVALFLPAVMLLAERLYSFRSLRDLIRARWRFYTGVAATWCLIGIWVAGGERAGELSVGDRLSDPLVYAGAQCREVLNYLKLTLYPAPLVFYRTPRFPSSPADFLPQLAALVGVAWVWYRAARSRRWLVLAGGCFAAVLLPTSSFIPVPLEPAAEFRMYFPSACALIASGGAAALVLRKAGVRPAAAAFAGVCLLAGAAMLTHERARDYRSRVAIWGDTVRKQPENLKAWANLSVALIESGRAAEAEVPIRMVAALTELHGIGDPSWAPRLAGDAACARGDLNAAEEHYMQALAASPGEPVVSGKIGILLQRSGRPAEALPHLERALAVRSSKDLLEAKALATEAASGD